MEVILTPFVAKQTKSLADLLFAKGYFSWVDDAENYVLALVDFIYSIPSQKHYRTKHPKYGHWYCRYKPNKHTTYYITFDTDGQRYLIKNIISSHTPQYPRYIKGI
jgi:hypothetical protein